MGLWGFGDELELFGVVLKGEAGAEPTLEN